MAMGCDFVGSGLTALRPNPARVQGTAGMLDFLSPLVGLVSPLAGAFLPFVFGRPKQAASGPSTGGGAVQDTSAAALAAAQARQTQMLLVAGGIGLVAIYLMTRRRR